MKFELKESLRGASDEKLLDDMRRCAKAIGRDTITKAQYGEIGRAHPNTLAHRFGSWAKALKLAGLQPSRSKYGITDEELFENIKSLWISLGRQPQAREIKNSTTYIMRFGSWLGALRAFVAWVNADSPDQNQQDVKGERGTAGSTIQRAATKRRTCREISDRQRFRILVRDGFRCRTCGASPLTQLGIELHVDHILPWSKGGETTDDNLETKCRQCNLGKGNAFHA
ncbi:MAG: HNH endonuclease [Pirellulales bacterium]|nr:HNH endonuclease [Pirellulales bacterium]